MTPIQFQKEIRLREARARLIAEPGDVAGAGFAVGYDSPSQFSREYRRMFGVPPSRDARRAARPMIGQAEDLGELLERVRMLGLVPAGPEKVDRSSTQFWPPAWDDHDLAVPGDFCVVPPMAPMYFSAAGSLTTRPTRSQRTPRLVQ